MQQLPLQNWAELAAIVSAMVDVINIGRDSFVSYFGSRSRNPQNVQHAAILMNSLSSYSNDEIEAIANRIYGCRKRFISEGDGAQRSRCLCSVLSDVRAGNGGRIPIPAWEEMFNKLKC